MAEDYADVAELKQTLSMAGENFADDDLELAITAASRGIDKACDRRFWKDADADQERFYSPESDRILLIDDLVELTGLETDFNASGTFSGGWSPNTDFVLHPLNAEADGEPWNMVVIHPQAFRIWPKDTERSVKIAGRFGWPEVPEQIHEATLIIASKLMRRAREAPFGVVGIGMDGGAVRTATRDPEVNFLLEPFHLPTVR